MNKRPYRTYYVFAAVWEPSTSSSPLFDTEPAAAALTLLRLSSNALLTATSLTDRALSTDCTDDAVEGARAGGLGRFRLVVTPFLRLSVLVMGAEPCECIVPRLMELRPESTVPFLETVLVKLAVSRMLLSSSIRAECPSDGVVPVSEPASSAPPEYNDSGIGIGSGSGNGARMRVDVVVDEDLEPRDRTLDAGVSCEGVIESEPVLEPRIGLGRGRYGWSKSS